MNNFDTAPWSAGPADPRSARPGGARAPTAEEPAVVFWRDRLLISAGFPATLAHTVAVTPGIDIHELLNLVDRGCPPDLAVRILWPLAG